MPLSWYFSILDFSFVVGLILSTNFILAGQLCCEDKGKGETRSRFTKYILPHSRIFRHCELFIEVKKDKYAAMEIVGAGKKSRGEEGLMSTQLT